MVKIRGKLRRMPSEYVCRDVFASANESKVYREIIVEHIGTGCSFAAPERHTGNKRSHDALSNLTLEGDARCI